jgi:hypothetical protein
MEPGEKERREKLYDEHRKQAWEDLQNSSDNFDKSVLTLSSGALGLSLSFIKDIVPLNHAMWLLLLYLSWSLFGLCIVLTVLSYQFGIRAQKEHLRNLPDYYLQGDEKASKQKGRSWRAVEAFSLLSAGLFTLGLICTVVFCIKNLEGSRMSDIKMGQDARSPVAMTPCAPENTTVPANDVLQKSRQPIAMTPVQPVQQAQPVAPVVPATSTDSSQPNVASQSSSTKTPE